MNNIKFNLKFNTKIDSKNQLNSIEKFWNKYFIEFLSDSLLHNLNFSENWAKNSVAAGHLTQKKFDTYTFSKVRETAKNTTQEIRDSIVYNILSTNENIQDIEVSFSINYNIPKSSKYCGSVEEYLNRLMIQGSIDQTEDLLKVTKQINTPKSIRVAQMDCHFLDLLQQMKNTLQIEKPAKKLKM